MDGFSVGELVGLMTPNGNFEKAVGACDGVLDGLLRLGNADGNTDGLSVVGKLDGDIEGIN
jgi:hypothetical protein